MVEYFSCELYRSIFRRHIERKMIEIGINSKLGEKTVLNFNAFKSVNKNNNNDNSEIITDDVKGYGNNYGPFIESRNECRIQERQQFSEWFMGKIKHKTNIMEIINGLLPANEISIIVRSNEHLLLMNERDAADSVIELPTRNCWAIITLIDQCCLCLFASKPMLIAVLEACATDLEMDNADLYRVISFIADCDRPIVDLQLAWSFVNDSHNSFPHSLSELRSIIHLQQESQHADGHNDSKLLFDIYKQLRDELIARDSMDVYLFIGCAANAVLAGLEYLGIDIDIGKWRVFQIRVNNELEALECQAFKIAGSTLCLTSPLHLRELIYGKLKLHDNLSIEQRNDLGIHNLINIRSTNELTLSKLSSFHPLPDVVIRYRHMSKTKSIYVDSFSSFIDINKSTISGSWDQNASVTGRIYCSKPNLQAFPRDSHSDSAFPPDQLSINVKSIFLSSSRYTYVSSDFSQIELRLFAHLSNDKRLIQLILSADRDQEDLFTIMADILGLQRLVGCEARQITKRVIYACLYGIGSKGLTEILSVSLEQAKAMIDKVKNYLPSLVAFSADCIKHVEDTNFLVTIVGRRRYFPSHQTFSSAEKWQLKRQLMSYVIQGSAADICKIAMINCQRAIGYKCLDARLILSRHDELVWRVNNEDLIDLIDIIYREMNVSSIRFHCGTRVESIQLSVPMKIKVKKGPSLVEMELLEHLTE